MFLFYPPPSLGVVNSAFYALAGLEWPLCGEERGEKEGREGQRKGRKVTEGIGKKHTTEMNF